MAYGTTHLVQVPGDLRPTVPLGSGFRLYDDDDFGLLEEALRRIDLVNDQMKDHFRVSFIEVVDAGVFNIYTHDPFRVHDDL